MIAIRSAFRTLVLVALEGSRRHRTCLITGYDRRTCVLARARDGAIELLDVARTAVFRPAVR